MRWLIGLVCLVIAAPSCGTSRRTDTARETRARTMHPGWSEGDQHTVSSGSSPSPSAAIVTTDPTPPPPSTTTAIDDLWLSAPTLETLEGRVSYYHDSLAGHHTANGELYDPTAFTCASRDLPFGTLLRIVRPDTGASVVVRVNDRGPWGRRRPRILDLSRAAAEAIDMIRAGVLEVRAEIVRRGE